MAARFPRLRNFSAALVLAATVAAAPGFALAQGQPASPPKKKVGPTVQPKTSAERTKSLDFLFGALKVAPDDASARHVEQRIWSIWMQTPSDTAALLMLRARAAMEAQQMDIALKLLDAVIKLRPDYVEAWNRRATLYYMQNDYARSLAD